MRSLPWADVLVGEAGRAWRTVPQERSVLVVVHTVTAATRLLDVLALWAGDHRVQTAFTCTRTSAFTTGTEEFLRERGIEPIPWEQAVDREFDLAVAASYGGPLQDLRAPLIILPHGMGYNKFEPGARSPEPGARSPEPGARSPFRVRFSVFPSPLWCTTAGSFRPSPSSPIPNSGTGSASTARKPLTSR